jgi:hypothetical protein
MGVEESTESTLPEKWRKGICSFPKNPVAGYGGSFPKARLEKNGKHE